MIPLNYFKAEVRKSVLAPFFLDSSASVLAGVAELAKHFESLLGTKYSEFDEEKPVEIVGDYRLGKSFQHVLHKYFFAFRTIQFEEAVALHSGLIKSYADLRLFVFGLLENGFTKNRQEVYERAEKELGASLDFDTVLWLDHPDNWIFKKMRDFDMGSFVRLYNSEVLDTLFLNSTSVSFRLKSFDKKIFWVCKKNWLLFDISKEDNLFVLNIFGPLELFGKLSKYGYRIARAVPQLVPYSEGLSARLAIKNKALTFSISSEVFESLVKETRKGEELKGESEVEFDSFPEQEFFDYFRSNKEGWIIEREPEPVVQQGVVFVPDFCITRGKSKVFVEIIGFWTKEYQEKKLWKLSKLKNVNLVLVVSDKYEKEAKKHLEALGYPLLCCDFGKIGAITVGVLRILEENYSDFAERYAGIVADHGVMKSVEDCLVQRKYVLLPELKRIFQAFTDEEFDKLFLECKKLIKSGVIVEGAGLFSEEKLAELKETVKGFEDKPRQDLVGQLEPDLSPYADALLSHFGYAVKWKSLGDAVIVRAR